MSVVSWTATFVVVVAVFIGVVLDKSPSWHSLRDNVFSRKWEAALLFEGQTIDIARAKNGVVHLHGNGSKAFAHGLGYIHAKERLLQMVLMRSAAQGRLVELFPTTEDTLNMDIMARSMEFGNRAAKALLQFDSDVVAFLEAYSQGVNTYMDTHWRPVELRIARVDPDPWQPVDCVAISFIMSYLGKTA